MTLNFRRFSGSIPTEFGDLASLRTLELDYLFSLTGTIPTEMGQLSALGKLKVICRANLLLDISQLTSLSATLRPRIALFYAFTITNWYNAERSLYVGEGWISVGIDG